MQIELLNVKIIDNALLLLQGISGTMISMPDMVYVSIFTDSDLTHITEDHFEVPKDADWYSFYKEDYVTYTVFIRIVAPDAMTKFLRGCHILKLKNTDIYVDVN